MFLGPLEQAKPWNTAGITGVYGFLKKLWRLYFDDNGLNITNDEPTVICTNRYTKTIKKLRKTSRISLQYFGFAIYDLCE